MKKSFHVCQSVDGALANWKKDEWSSIAKSNNISMAEAKRLFKLYRFEGKRVIPIGDCDNFSFQDGCLGHETSE